MCSKCRCARVSPDSSKSTLEPDRVGRSPTCAVDRIGGDPHRPQRMSAALSSREAARPPSPSRQKARAKTARTQARRIESSSLGANVAVPSIGLQMALQEVAGRPELNGQLVTIERIDRLTAMIGVRILSSSETLIVRQANLAAASAAAAPDVAPLPPPDIGGGETKGDAAASSSDATSARPSSPPPPSPPARRARTERAAISARVVDPAKVTPPPTPKRSSREAVAPTVDASAPASGEPPKSQRPKSQRTNREMMNVKVGVRCRPLSRQEKKTIEEEPAVVMFDETCATHPPRISSRAHHP